MDNLQREKKRFAHLCTEVLHVLVLVLLFGMASCIQEDNIVPEVSVPDGYVNYFVEDLSFNRSAREAKVAFQINVDWTMEVVAVGEGSNAWCSVEPASGDAGLHKVVVRVARLDKEEFRFARLMMKCGDSKVAEITVVQEKAETVDLGLSVKWASLNIGADSPVDYGKYYAWAETEEKSDYSAATYKYVKDLDGDGDYYDDDANWTNVGTDISGTSYDVAHVKWGNGWRMPTLLEFEELRNRCSWEWTGSGYRVTGPNGNSIFLPAAFYWTGTFDERFPSFALTYWLYQNRKEFSTNYRNEGHPVRPVKD